MTGTPRYKIWRSNVIARDRKRCQLCGASSRKLEVHHIVAKRIDPSLVITPDNGITLCRRCHRGIVNSREESFVYIFSRIVEENNRRMSQ